MGRKESGNGTLAVRIPIAEMVEIQAMQGKDNYEKLKKFFTPTLIKLPDLIPMETIMELEKKVGTSLAELRQAQANCLHWTRKLAEAKTIYRLQHPDEDPLTELTQKEN